ncbi:unnamed protein product [Brassica rapa subsp. trilocularis]
MSSESSGSNRRRNRESRSGSPHRLEATPYMSFESRLEATRVLFVSNAPVPNPWSLRHRDITALSGYEPLIGNPLCINGAEVDTHIRRGRRRGRARLG